MLLHILISHAYRYLSDSSKTGPRVLVEKRRNQVPGFQTFTIESFAANCCLYIVLEKSFDLRDANTLVLFGGIITSQKVMYEKFGENFIAQFVSKGFLAAHCPPDFAQQYHQKLQSNDTKAFKAFYQSLIENLRQLNCLFVLTFYLLLWLIVFIRHGVLSAMYI